MPVHTTKIAPGEHKPTVPRRFLRWSAGALLLVMVVFLYLHATEFRMLEARVLSLWLNPILDGGVRPNDTHYLVYLPDNLLIAFNITMECTALLLLSPLAVTTAAILMFTRVGMLRALAGFVISVAATFVVNQLRLALIAWTTQTWGLDFGYDIGHRFIGSLIALFGFALGLLIILWIALRPTKKQ